MNELVAQRSIPTVLRGEPTTAAVAFLRTLVDLGLGAVFGIPGGTISPLFDALASVPGLRCVTTRHEATAAFAALGYARATGRPALVLTTSGPGLTNAITGISSAWYEELPLIVAAGEVPIRAQGRGTLQDGSASGLQTRAMLAPITRWCGMLHAPVAAAGLAFKAWHAALGDAPGPVVVTMPLDVAGASATFPVIGAAPRAPMRADPVACRAAAALLAHARRPLIVLGRGARDAASAVVALAERCAARVVVTGHAKGGFPEHHPLYLGVIGLGQHPGVVDFLAEAPDVTLIVGSRLNDLATNGWSLPLDGTTATIQIDRDPLLIGTNASVTLGIVGDARVSVLEIGAALPRDVVVTTRRAVRRRRIDDQPPAFADRRARIKPQHLLAQLSHVFPDAVWCSDIGEHLAFALHYLDVDSPEHFHDMLGFGSMGSGIGAAIGVQHADASRRVVCVCGDGGFASYLGELMTCAENGIGVLFVVFNDGRWNMVDHGFRAVYGAVPAGMPAMVGDFAGAARALGVDAAVVNTLDELERLELAEVWRAGRPFVLDARIDAEQSLTRDTRSASIKHFRADASVQ